jgi:uncharacterized glyoxalase superfamily protein PhnB
MQPEEDAVVASTRVGAPNIFPCLSYQDAPAAMEWLSRAFGFETLMVVPGVDGTIEHAEMKLGAGGIMLGSEKPDNPCWLSPRRLDGINQCVYVCLDEVDAHYARAKAAGAEIMQELEDTDYGSRGYMARDPEGHVWFFGTYLPET